MRLQSIFELTLVLDSEKFNKLLNRAGSISEYSGSNKYVDDTMISKGIRENRIQFVGYGYSKPIATNDTEEGRAMNRRTEFTIIGF